MPICRALVLAIQSQCDETINSETKNSKIDWRYATPSRLRRPRSVFLWISPVLFCCRRVGFRGHAALAAAIFRAIRAAHLFWRAGLTHS